MYMHSSGIFPITCSFLLTPQLVADNIPELAETASVHLTAISSGTALLSAQGNVATIEIGRNNNPDGIFAFSANVSSVIVLEEGQTITLTVVRTAGAASSVDVDYVTSPSFGLDGGSGRLVFRVGVRTANITLSVPDDDVPEEAQDFTLALQEPNAGELGAYSVVTVRVPSSDDANGVLNMTGSALIEAEELPDVPNPVTVTVRRLAGRFGTISVPWTLQRCSGSTPALCGERRDAAADIGATAGTLTFGPGVARRDISFDVLPDTIQEAAELFVLSLGEPTGGARRDNPEQAIYVLVPANDDAVGFNAATIHASEDDGAAVLDIVRNGSALQRIIVSVAVSDAPGSRDDVARPWSGSALQLVTFEAGERTRSFSVPLVADSITQPQRSFVVSLSRNDGSGNHVIDSTATEATVIVRANPDAGGVFSLAFGGAGSSSVRNSTEASPAKNVTVVISRSGSTFGSVHAAISVGGECDAADLSASPARATFAEGDMTQQITLTIVNDQVPELKEDCVLSLILTDVQGILGTLNTDANANEIVLAIASSDDPYGVIGFSARVADGTSEVGRSWQS